MTVGRPPAPGWCSGCRRLLPAAAFTTTGRGRYYYCRDCQRARANARNRALAAVVAAHRDEYDEEYGRALARIPVPDGPVPAAGDPAGDPAKVCRVCLRMLPLAVFPLRARRPDGRASWCRECVARANRARAAARLALAQAHPDEYQQTLEQEREAIPVAADEPIPSLDEGPVVRMTSGELQVVREFLGLTDAALASILEVNERTVRSWEQGRARTPRGVRAEVEAVERATAAAVGDLVDALGRMRTPAVVVYRSDAELHAARPSLLHVTARWWRHVVARACQEVPGVVIGWPDEIEMES